MLSEVIQTELSYRAVPLAGTALTPEVRSLRSSRRLFPSHEEHRLYLHPSVYTGRMLAYYPHIPVSCFSTRNFPVVHESVHLRRQVVTGSNLVSETIHFVFSSS